MFRNPILKAKFQNYVNKYELNKDNEEDNIRKYICYTYLSQIQPDRLDRDFDLLDKICDVKLTSLGIIGFAITLNNQLLTTKSDIDDILQTECKGKFDLYLITYRNDIDIDKVLLEIANDEDFFDLSEMISYMNSQRIVSKWDDLPNVNFIIISDRTKDEISVRKELFIEKIHQIDEDKILRIAKSNENDYEPILEYTDGFSLKKEGKEGQTIVTLCEAGQLIDILQNEDGMIRANIFDANVRAYQGNTDVNNEMIKTLREAPRNFVLFNNGITIVCTKLVHSGKSLKMTNPQVVNGCQTCNSLFKAYKDGVDLSKVNIIVKTIETTDDKVTQGIVRGTNRQNIVYEVAFETTRQFHKDLEDFFNIMETPSGLQRVYYERRAKQYYFESQIKPYQKINFRMLIQSVVALYMNKVEISHRHESKLITEYKDKLFVDGQSFYPYYVAALLTANLDYLMKKERMLIDLRNYKMHILFVLQELNMGPSPNINDKEEIERYCEKFLQILKKNNFKKLVDSATHTFRTLMAKWIDKKGKNYRFAIKDKTEFTEFMLEELRGNTKRFQSDSIYSGIIMTINKDKNGNLYGFITCKPNNIYFNELDNPNINSSYVGKEVSYKVIGFGNETRAINVRLI